MVTGLERDLESSLEVALALARMPELKPARADLVVHGHERSEFVRAFELRRDLEGHCEFVLDACLGVDPGAQGVVAEARPSENARIAGLSGRIDHARQEGVGTLELATADERLGEREHCLEADRVVGGDVDCPLKQRCRGREIGASERAEPGPQQLRGGSCRQLVVLHAELPPEGERLLEVVAEDLVELEGHVAAALLEPRGQPLVQAGAQLLRHRGVRRVTDQQVPEPVRVQSGDE